MPQEDSFDLVKSVFAKHTITTLVDERDMSVWFLLSDIEEAWDHSNLRVVASRSLNTKHLRDVTISDSTERKQKQKFISESGLYILAFRSNKPEAEKFTEWAADLIAKIRSGKVELKVRAQGLQEHLNIDLQKRNSIAFNSREFLAGGKQHLIQQNAEITRVISDRHLNPGKYKELAKELGHKNIKSGLDAVRALDPHNACAISAAKNFLELGAAKDDAYDLAKQTNPIYARMLELGLTPKELDAEG